MSALERLCIERGIRLTGQRRVIVRIMSEARDHPDADTIRRRALEREPGIGIATVYRTLRALEANGLVQSRKFGRNRAFYERTDKARHDHLIDVDTGKVVEFHDQELEEIKLRVARDLGYVLVDHRLDLYGKALPADADQDGHPPHTPGTDRSGGG